jgi:hypothetical protein
MTRRLTTDFANSTTVLVERTGLSPEQIKIGLALIRTGRTDLIAKAIAGEMTAVVALAAARRSHIKP